MWGGWDDAVRDDPFPTFAEARRRCPVHHVHLPDGHDAWVVLGHESARRALGDARLSKDMVATLDRDPEVLAEGLPGPDYAHHMLAVDEPDHARLRGLVASAFRPSRVAAMRPTVEGLADRLLDALAARGPDAIVDLRAGFAHPLPFAVIGALLGVGCDHRRTLEDAFTTLLRPWPTPPPAEAVTASEVVTATLGKLVDGATPNPDGDLVEVLVDAVVRGVATRAEALSSLFQLVVAGHDTTSSLIGNGVVALLDHPDQLARLRGDPRLLPDAVEELLRFTAAVPHATFRVTSEAVELGGVTVPAGKQVLVGLGAANRDPAFVDRPEHLDITRRPGRHLAFGHGPHHCLGAALARLEADVAFGRLLSRFPELRLAVPRRELAWSHGDGLVLRGLGSLPVVLGPEAPPPAVQRAVTYRLRNGLDQRHARMAVVVQQMLVVVGDGDGASTGARDGIATATSEHADQPHAGERPRVPHGAPTAAMNTVPEARLPCRLADRTAKGNTMEIKNLGVADGLPPVDWDAIVDKLERRAAPAPDAPNARTTWLTTINDDGSPHVTAVGAVWVDGTFWFQTGSATQKFRNVARDPRCTVATSIQDADVVFEGSAVRETDPGAIAPVVDAWVDGGWPVEPDESGTGITAPFNAPAQGPPPWNVFRVAPRSALVVFGAEPGGLTRFTF
jgi:cytochrome P450